jgi:hypothetical protein
MGVRVWNSSAPAPGLVLQLHRRSLVGFGEELRRATYGIPAGRASATRRHSTTCNGRRDGPPFPHATGGGCGIRTRSLATAELGVPTVIRAARSARGIDSGARVRRPFFIGGSQSADPPRSPEVPRLPSARADPNAHRAHLGAPLDAVVRQLDALASLGRRRSCPGRP